jgi:hypothetical protein
MNAPRASSIIDVHALSELVPPATLAEARDHRDALARLLGSEREAAADFLLALADFDHRRGWARLGHASLFAFLTRELALSNGAAWLRLSAARLLPRFPAVEAALRRGQLCLSAVGELSRVLTEENAAQVLPRFFRRSAREAREVAAAILPMASPPRRDVVTLLPAPGTTPVAASTALAIGPCLPLDLPSTTALSLTSPTPAQPTCASLTTTRPPLRAHEVAPSHPARESPASVEPLTADLRRLHVTVSARFLEKVSAARDGLSHALPGATTEQVLEAALDLLLDQQARRKSLVKRPRSASGANSASVAASVSVGTQDSAPAPAPATRPRPSACVEREVRLRDGGRCQYPLDAGGVCGSTWQVELDHLVPLALGGPTTVENLRCVCASHNRQAAEEALGPVLACLRARRRCRRR